MMSDLSRGFVESVSCIRDLGFNNVLGLGAPQEQMFFVDSQGNRSLHLKSAFSTPEEIVKEGIEYMRRHADTLQEYLDNGMNNNTHEWVVKMPHDFDEARRAIDAWFKDDPDGGKNRAEQRIRAQVRRTVKEKCYAELGLSDTSSSFHGSPVDFEHYQASDLRLSVNAILTAVQLRRLPAYADEYLSLYYKAIAKLTDTWVPTAVSAEQPPPQPTVKFADVVLVCGTPTCTGRVFPRAVVMAAVKKFKYVVGTLPVYIGFKDDRSVAEVAGVTKDLQMDGDQLVAYVETLDTPEGRRLADLMKSGRAKLVTDGSGEVGGDSNVVQDFTLEALVAVGVPPEPAKPMSEKLKDTP